MAVGAAVAAIASRLPHRYPFLFVDRLDRIEPGRLVRARHSVSPNDRWLSPDPTGAPAMPSTLLLECVAQVGATLVLALPEWSGHLPVMIGIDRVRIRGGVRAGDEAVVEVRLLRMNGPTGRMHGTVRVEGRLIASGRVTFVLVVPR